MKLIFYLFVLVFYGAKCMEKKNIGIEMETLNKYILLFHSFHFADHASRLNFVSLHSQCTFIESNTRESIATTSNYEHCGLYDYFYLPAIPVWMREAYWLLVSASQ